MLVWLPSLDIWFGVSYVWCICKLAPNWWVIFFHVVMTSSVPSKCWHYSLDRWNISSVALFFIFLIYISYISSCCLCVCTCHSVKDFKSIFLTVHEVFNRLDQSCNVLISIFFPWANFEEHWFLSHSSGATTSTQGQQYSLLNGHFCKKPISVSLTNCFY